MPDSTSAQRLFLSILPDQNAGTVDCATPGNCFTQSGRQITPELFNGGASASLTITVAGQPVPTAQIFARAFQDSAPIDGVWRTANSRSAAGQYSFTTWVGR